MLNSCERLGTVQSSCRIVRMKRRSSRESSARHDEPVAKIRKTDDTMDIDLPTAEAEQSKPAESQPAESQPAESKPAESKPAESQHAEPSKPSEQPRPMLTRKTSGGKPLPVLELPPLRRKTTPGPNLDSATVKQQRKLEEK